MKVICTTKKEINTTTTCKKEFCCERLERAFNEMTEYDHYYYPAFVLTQDNKVYMATHYSSHDGSETAPIDYCPFCGTRLIVENINIDNTEKLPKEPPLETIYDYKKDNLWTWFKEWFK